MPESYSETMRRELGANALKGNASRIELYEALDLLIEAVGELRQQIKALESREDAFKGIHQRALAYRKGDLVTAKGGLWIALQDAPAGKAPGHEPDFWQLGWKAK